MSRDTEATTACKTLIEFLDEAKYSFICPSPESQGRVVRKRSSDPSTADAQSLQDFWGWSLPCSEKALRALLHDALFESLRQASLITSAPGDKYRSAIRVSDFYLPKYDARDAQLYYIHSSFPASSDSVFFGPDTYLFVAFLQTLKRHLQIPPKVMIDVCCGSGAGAIHVSKTFPQAQAIGLDLNPRALSMGGINAELAGSAVRFYQSDLYAAVPEDLISSGIDLIVSNPPYIASSPHGEDLPIYADGGAEFGLGLSLRIVEEGLKILSSTGMIVVYTGVAISVTNPGHDAFLEKLKTVKDAELAEYTILHPDMWPEEIGKGSYADVGRIQVVGAVLKSKSR
ncbi:S-adenosyl-L-methionine-dependent methyltransferase [Phaeosphaeria sp. MPI-PUGE-AT-0046c]|nr:S-adenosyl-L-methionine-dependent methyltransferase [Phaeosphaeria sp. MPI-PUGE-AT-0046c]